ncbi:MAG TPA: energy transducer TonB [Pyrinomonadaceae bacterium]|nr:energy transducer TonB [Pyrinomonadaceae bacterium]
MKRLAVQITTAALVLCAPLVAAEAQSGRRGGDTQERTYPLPAPTEPQPAKQAPAPQGPAVLCMEKGRQSEKDALLKQAQSEPVFRSTEVDERAMIKAKPNPRYTEEARRNGTAGVARLRVLLSGTGKVTLVSVLSGPPDGLTEMAIDAACHIKFEPAMKRGQPVAQYVTVEYNFNVYHRGPMFPQRIPRWPR